MFLEKWQSILVEPAIETPIGSKCPVVLPCFVGDAKFIQFVQIDCCFGFHPRGC